MTGLLTEIKNCQLCASSLVNGVRPVVQIAPQARILIIGQAPGRKVHQSGIHLTMPVATDYVNG